jgi:glycosyltransferase involved in cell wall biosynthesis
MAVGLPVVTTSRALLSLGAVPDRDILVGDTPKEFSAAVLRLLGNTTLGVRVSDAGRLFVRNNHDWGKISEQLVEIYENVALSMKTELPQKVRGNLF